MSIPTEISIEDWNNYIEQSYNIIVNITKEQLTDMLITLTILIKFNLRMIYLK